MHKFELDLYGIPVIAEVGEVATQTDGSCMLYYGDTVVLSTVVAEASEEILDFLPLMVEYKEKTYAAGRIPGGFFKREGKPGNREVLISRMIDRPVRPMFADGYSDNTQLVSTLLSADPNYSVDIPAMNASFMALHLSDIPFKGPLAAVKVGCIDGELILNPSFQELEKSSMELVLVVSDDAIIMIEAFAKEIEEELMLKALSFGTEKAGKLLEFQHEMRKQAGKEKREFRVVDFSLDENLQREILDIVGQGIERVNAIPQKLVRSEEISRLKKDIISRFESLIEEDSFNKTKINNFLEEQISLDMRKRILETGIRIDGRKCDEVRPITTKIGFLPKAHGCAIFKRGETQVLAVITFGSPGDEQRIDSVEGEDKESFMLHYNFPPYSVHEAKPLRFTSRREIGHGNLAKMAIQPLLPDNEEFPYVIRVVCEVLESNGSSSMASVASSSLALMDAGVPIKKHVAGAAMGLVKDKDNWVVLTDILGQEDHLGDMDFKVAGTMDGITAVQLDVKIPGINDDILRKVFEDARKGREHIINILTSAIPEPRPELSENAPRIITIELKNGDRIKDIIGPGGKIIKKMVEDYGVAIDIDNNTNTVKIYGSDMEKAKEAEAAIKEIVKEPEVGEIYEGKVAKITTFGAFVEILPGVQGLLHISEIENRRIAKVEDVLKEGEIVKVLVLEIDKMGKIRLSKKRLDAPKQD